MKTIAYRIKIDRAPTLEDQKNPTGLEGLVEELKKQGWADSKGNAIKEFKISYEGFAKPGNNNYLQWTATLVEIDKR